MDIHSELEKLKQPYLKKIDVLDKGFVRLVDFMGNDQRVVQAARVSYGEGTKTVREDKGLIDYLLRHDHTSPFEQVHFTFHVKMPIFIARQTVRTRTACLSGDTFLWFDEPAAVNKKTRKSRKTTIKNFYDKWHNGTTSTYITKRKNTYTENIIADNFYTVPELAKIVDRREESIRASLHSGSLLGYKKNNKWQIKGEDWIHYAKQKRTWHNDIKPVLKKMNLRMCNEVTGEILHTHIKDIWSNGVKDVFEVTLENGYVIKMTKDHLCFSKNGWGTLEKLVNLKVSEKNNCSWSSDSPEFCVNGINAYQDYEWMSEQRKKGLNVQEISVLAGCSYHTIRKWLKVHKLQFSAKEKAFFSGKTQTGTKRSKGNYKVSEETKQKIREARSGEKSNFWKGGMSKERENIGRWTTQIARSVHKKYNFKCAVCESNQKLEAHHIDPVYNNPERAYDFSNLISLCKSCHGFLHYNNLEIAFMELYKNNENLKNILNYNKSKRNYIQRSQKLVRTYSKIKNIKYVGKEEVFDIEVEGPYHNFIANGFVVHNSINEISGRYSVLSDEFYIPTLSRMQKQSEDNKQGSSSELIDEADEVLKKMIHEQELNYDNYESYLKTGMARELARINLPLSTYTEWYWTIDLLNLMKFLRLRLDSHAQLEIREYAQAKYDLIKPLVPYTCESFERHWLKGKRFSEDELGFISKLMTDKASIRESLSELGWKKSKINEFLSKI